MDGLWCSVGRQAHGKARLARFEVAPPLPFVSRTLLAFRWTLNPDLDLDLDLELGVT